MISDHKAVRHISQRMCGEFSDGCPTCLRHNDPGLCRKSRLFANFCFEKNAALLAAVPRS